MKQMSFFDSQEMDVRWMDDPALLHAVVSGDGEAFAELMRRHDARVRRSLPAPMAAEFWVYLLRDEKRALREWIDRLTAKGVA